MKKYITLAVLLLAIVFCFCGCDSVKPKEVLEHHPFLLGEWQSEYFAKDPLLILNEDGTCVFNGTAGKWSGIKQKVYITEEPRLTVKLENKEVYELNWNRIYTAAEIPTYEIEVFKDGTAVDFAAGDRFIKMDEKIDVLQEFPWLVGEWTNSPDEGAKIILREDGTCNFYGTETVWCMSYSDYYSTISMSDVFCPVAIKSGETGKTVFDFTAYGNEESGYAQNSHSVQFRYAENSQYVMDSNVDPAWYNLGKLTTVEITPENIGDYFEVFEQVKWNTDDFGTVVSADINTYLRLKEEYEPLIVMARTDIAVELKKDVALYKLNMTANEIEYTRDFLSSDDISTSTQKVGLHILPSENSDSLEFICGIGIAEVRHHLDETKCAHYMVEDFEILRAAGTITLYDMD